MFARHLKRENKYRFVRRQRSEHLFIYLFWLIDLVWRGRAQLPIIPLNYNEMRWIGACSQSSRTTKRGQPLSDQSNKFNQTSTSRSLSALIHPADTRVNAFSVRDLNEHYVVLAQILSVCTKGHSVPMRVVCKESCIHGYSPSSLAIQTRSCGNGLAYSLLCKRLLHQAVRSLH